MDMYLISNEDKRIIVRIANDYRRQPYDVRDTKAANMRRMAKIISEKLERKKEQ